MGGGVGNTPNPVISGGMAQSARKLDDPENPSPLLGLKPRQHFAAVVARINGD